MFPQVPGSLIQKSDGTPKNQGPWTKDKSDERRAPCCRVPCVRKSTAQQDSIIYLPLVKVHVGKPFGLGTGTDRAVGTWLPGSGRTTASPCHSRHGTTLPSARGTEAVETESRCISQVRRWPNSLVVVMVLVAADVKDRFGKTLTFGTFRHTSMD